MDAPKLDYRKEPKRPADTLGITAVVLASTPKLVIGTAGRRTSVGWNPCEVIAPLRLQMTRIGIPPLLPVAL